MPSPLAREWKILDRIPRERLRRVEVQREFVLTHELEAVYPAALAGDLDDIANLLILVQAEDWQRWGRFTTFKTNGASQVAEDVR